MRISDWSSDVCSSDLGIAGQAAPQFPGLRISGQDRHAVEALLPMPDGAIARVADCRFGKALVRGLEFLQAHHIGSRFGQPFDQPGRSEEHTSELQSLMRISYAVFCLTKKTTKSIYKQQLTIYTALSNHIE